VFCLDIDAARLTHALYRSYVVVRCAGRLRAHNWAEAPRVFLELEAQTIPTAVGILVANDVKVSPSMLLDAFPWQAMLAQPPVRVATGEQVSREIAKLYEDVSDYERITGREIMCVCVRACVRVCVRACVRVCVCV
jgi:hypothetical protein